MCQYKRWMRVRRLMASEHPGLFGDKCVLVIDRPLRPLRCTFNKGDGCAALNRF
jgi:hypothetical protein